MRCALHSVVFWLLGCGSASVEPAEAARPSSTTSSSAPSFKAEVSCPTGTVYDGTVCKPLVVINCPLGTKFEQEVGCVAVVVDSPSPSPSFVLPVAPGAPPPACACLPNDMPCVMRCSQKRPGFTPLPSAEPLRNSESR